MTAKQNVKDQVRMYKKCFINAKQSHTHVSILFTVALEAGRWAVAWNTDEQVTDTSVFG